MNRFEKGVNVFAEYMDEGWEKTSRWPDERPT